MSNIGKKILCELCGREVRKPRKNARHHFCWRCHSYRKTEVFRIAAYKQPKGGVPA
jgi:ribosome-binding protein aMBF1 (putative translation factor)